MADTATLSTHAIQIIVTWKSELGGMKLRMETLAGPFDSSAKQLVWNATFLQKFRPMQQGLASVGIIVEIERSRMLKDQQIPAGVPFADFVEPERLLKKIGDLCAASRTE